jgi:hypothetical protein
MARIALLLALTTAVLCAWGCALSSKPAISQRAVERIRIGVTTSDQILAAFGEPTGRYRSGSAGSRWVYERGVADPADEQLLGAVVSDVLGAASTRRPLPTSAYSLPAAANKRHPESLVVDFDTTGVVLDFEYSKGQ